jgi:hypothetical protein
MSLNFGCRIPSRRDNSSSIFSASNRTALSPTSARKYRAHSDLSIRAALAHEAVGHRGAEVAGQGYNNETPLGHALDEAQAHFRAALHAPGLSGEERATLWAAGFERLQSQGLRFADIVDLFYLEPGAWNDRSVSPSGVQREPPSVP